MDAGPPGRRAVAGRALRRVTVWQGAGVADPVAFQTRTARGLAVRWPLVALVGLVVVVLIGSWLPGRAASQGIDVIDASSCPSQAEQVIYPDRPGRDRLLLPAAYQAAPVEAIWCRFGQGGALVSSVRVDAARTSRLAALLVAPPDGWPDDALAAKTIAPLTDAQLAELAAPSCRAPSVADLLVFGYSEGPDAAVLVRGEPCRDATNGQITLRTPPGVAEALAGPVGG